MQAISIGHAGILIRTRGITIVCDPWFEPAFFASWFVFPRNDRLPDDIMHDVCNPDFLYVSHLHGDHFDIPFLTERMNKDTTVILPGFPTREMERTFSKLGFRKFIRTQNAEETEIADGVRVAVHVETSITDGPGGDSALVVSDGTGRLVNQNDCRTTDVGALGRHGRVDLHFLQFSGAIWYPMVYDETPERMRELIDVKVDSQFTRAMRYVDVVDARYVVPSAGPPCFLDESLFGFNMITGDELSIFPDQREFLAKLTAAGHQGIMNVPGTCIEIGPDSMSVTHPMPSSDVEAIFSEKERYLRAYQADWAPWLAGHKAGWIAARPDLLERLKAWWEPLMAIAPKLRSAIGAGILLRAGDLDLNGTIDHGDIAALLTMIGSEPQLGIGDLDGDGVIDAADIAALSASVLKQD